MDVLGSRVDEREGRTERRTVEGLVYVADLEPASRPRSRTSAVVVRW